jgi:hypothetical protein
MFFGRKNISKTLYLKKVVISLNIEDVESSSKALKCSVTITLDCRRRKTTSFSPPFLSCMKIFSRYNPMYKKGGMIMKRSIMVTLIVLIIPWTLFAQDWIKHDLNSMGSAAFVYAADMDNDDDIDVLGGGTCLWWW